MKKIIYISLIIVVIICVLAGVLILKGNSKTIDLIYKDESNVQVTFKVDEKANYRLSENKDEFRTSREDAMLFGDTFNISVEVYDDLIFDRYSGSFEKYAEEHKEDDEYTEQTFNGIKGYSVYYGSYVRYEVLLPVKDSNKYFVKLCVYSTVDKNSKDSVKEQFESEKVRNILNNIEISIVE